MANYDISLIDYDIKTNSSLYNDVIMMSETMGICCYYESTGTTGYVESFTLDASKNITRVERLAVGSGVIRDPSLVKIDSTHFALAHADSASDGFIKTYSVTTSGTSINQLDSLEHDVVSGRVNGISLIDSTHLYLHYRDGSSDGRVKTFTLDGSYNITQTDSLVVANNYGESYNKGLLKFDSSHFIDACQINSSFHAGVKVYAYDGSYNLTLTTTSSAFNANASERFDLKQIDATHFMMVETSNNKVYAHTFSINASTYVVAEIDEIELLGSNTHGCSEYIDGTHMIAGFGNAVAVVTLDGSYNMTEGSNTTLTGSGEYTKIAKIDDSGNYIVGLAGGGNAHSLQTFNIEGIGGYPNKVNGVTGFAKLNGVAVGSIAKVNGV